MSVHHQTRVGHVESNKRDSCTRTLQCQALPWKIYWYVATSPQQSAENFRQTLRCLEEKIRLQTSLKLENPQSEHLLLPANSVSDFAFGGLNSHETHQENSLRDHSALLPAHLISSCCTKVSTVTTHLDIEPLFILQFW